MNEVFVWRMMITWNRGSVVSIFQPCFLYLPLTTEYCNESYFLTLVAEFGDYDESKHTPQFLNNYVILPSVSSFFLGFSQRGGFQTHLVTLDLERGRGGGGGGGEGSVYC